MAKLMVVDDDQTMVSLLQTLLELDGFEVQPMTRPEEFEENLIRTKPDLVIMDVFLANGDGIELLKRVRSMPDYSDLPIIMTSGMDVSDECLEAGADGFMLKPYAPPDLISMIRANLK